jgi:chemotaxis protein methyltransferase CheR
VHQTQLKDSEFKLFQSWLHQSTGINLSSAKKALVAGRLSKRLKHLDLKSFGDYFQFIRSHAAAEELQIAIDLLTTNETYFFREPKHFEFMSEKILPTLIPAKKFRVWSAASSSGEEAYSIAMTLANELTSTAWEIFGSDISTDMLRIARGGHYPIARARTIPTDMLSKYCLKGTGGQEGTFLVERNLRNKVSFAQINLNENLPDVGQFDLIFIRNVMIYFDQDTKCKVIERLLPHLKSGGYLFVSHSESLNGITNRLQIISPSIYKKP